MRVLITDIAWPEPAVERRILEAGGHDMVLAPDGSEPTLLRLAPGCGAIATCWAQVPASVIAAAGPSLKHVARYGVGLDNIDVAYCTEHDILVANVPDYSVDEVSDQALALMLALTRRTVALDRAYRAGTFSPQAAGPLRRLRGRTCGVVGLGRVGAAVARKAAAFGLSVLAWGPRLTAERAGEHGARLVDLPTLLRESDYVTLHCPLTAENYHLISAETIATMKRDACLINTARGGLVDTEALVVALRNGRLAGAGLDVLEGEPLPAGHPLFSLDSAIVAPHAAFYSEEALAELQRRTAEEIVRVAAGEPSMNPVNRRFPESG